MYYPVTGEGIFWTFYVKLSGSCDIRNPHQTAQHAPISSPLQAQSILAALFAIGPVYPLLDAVSLADPPMVPPTPLVGIVLVPTTIPVAPGSRLISVPETIVVRPPCPGVWAGKLAVVGGCGIEG
jgi:hypothetical protein